MPSCCLATATLVQHVGDGAREACSASQGLLGVSWEGAEQPSPPTSRELLTCGFVDAVGMDRDLFSAL